VRFEVLTAVAINEFSLLKYNNSEENATSIFRLEDEFKEETSVEANGRKFGSSSFHLSSRWCVPWLIIRPG
jgi:hypothetical protein